MRKAYRILIIIALYVAVLVLYIAFFLFQITNIPLFLVLTISSVTVLSTGTVYTVIQSRNEGIVKKKESIYKLPKKAGKKKTGDLIEDYYDSNVLIAPRPAHCRCGDGERPVTRLWAAPW